jgi:GNAT superfamily N-acetyltransferase
MAVTIRAATVDDVPAFVAMKNDAWRWAYAGILPEEYLAGLTTGDQVEAWRGRFAGVGDPGVGDPGVVIALEDGSVVGVVGYGACEDDDADERTGEIGMLYVVPDLVGTGLGSALLRAGLDGLRAAGFVRATLWVLEANGRGRGFYEHVGWKPDGARSSHMSACAHFPLLRYAITLTDG